MRYYVQLLIMAKQFDEATRIVNEILKVYPGDVVALAYGGQLQLIKGNPSAAVSTLQAAVKNDPSQAGAHYQLGLAYQAQGELQSAENEWREAIRLNPNMLQAQRTLALFAMRTADMSTLQTSASQIISLQPDKAEGYALRAIAYINQKKLQLAQQDIQKAIAVDPTSQLGYVQLGNLQFAQKNYAAAARAYQQGLDRDPNSSDALRGLMNSYLAQNQVDRAVAAANGQIARFPDNSEFYDLLGTSLFRAKKDFPGAEAAFSKALQVDPKNNDARLKLAQAQSTAGKLDQAIATCQQGIQAQPRVADYYILLGELYQAKGNWSLAKSSLEKARELQPGDPVAARE